MNFSIPMLGKGMALAQAWGMVNPSIDLGRSIRAILGSMVSSQSWGSMLTNTPQSVSPAGIAITSTGLLIVKLPCLDPLQWRIEQILSESCDLCSGRFESKRCNA